MIPGFIKEIIASDYCSDLEAEERSQTGESEQVQGAGDQNVEEGRAQGNLFTELVQSKEKQDRPVPPEFIRSNVVQIPPPATASSLQTLPPPPPPTSTPIAEARPVSSTDDGGGAIYNMQGDRQQTFNARTRKRWYYVFGFIVLVVLVAVAIAIPVAVTRGQTEATRSSGLSQYQCFQTTKELQDAVDVYLKVRRRDTAAAEMYGWPIDTWCVGEISDFAQLFSAQRNPLASAFDDPIGSWNVSHAATMRQMFRSAVKFNQDLSSWRVDRVSEMTEMFRGASRFKQDLCEWQRILKKRTVDVQDMFLDTSCALKEDPVLTSSDYRGGYFCTLWTYNASPTRAPDKISTPAPTPQMSPTPSPTEQSSPSPIEQPTPTQSETPSRAPTESPTPTQTTPAPTERPTSPSTDRPTALPGSKCFETTEELYDAVDEYLRNNSSDTNVAITYGWPIGSWCVSRITNFYGLFSYRRNSYTQSFDETLDSWDTSNAVTMEQMFQGQHFSGRPPAFNQNLSHWRTSKVTSMRYMFKDASSFNGQVHSWDTSSVTDMYSMFVAAKSFNGQIGAWDTSSVTNMAYMFYWASNFSGNLSEWKTERVTEMWRMFEGARSFNSDISGWNVSRVEDMHNMFFDATNFNQSLCAWGPQLTGRSVYVGGAMFAVTSCPLQWVTPNLTASPPGPFCHACT